MTRRAFSRVSAWKALAFLLSFSLSLTAAFPAHSSGANLRVEPADRAEMKGDFDLILYGARHSDDIETIAILDVAGDGYEIVPLAPEYDYRVRKGLPAKDALHDAESFAKWHRSAVRLAYRKILGPSGRVVGYEVRPLYQPFAYGEMDVMMVNYWTEDAGRVRVRVRLKYSVERQREGDGLFERRGPFR